eukprot:sb/3477468/
MSLLLASTASFDLSFGLRVLEVGAGVVLATSVVHTLCLEFNRFKTNLTTTTQSAYGKPTRDCRRAISPALEKSPPPLPFAWNFHLARFQYEEDWDEALLGKTNLESIC